jgi:hypothetical protein
VPNISRIGLVLQYDYAPSADGAFASASVAFVGKGMVWTRPVLRSLSAWLALDTRIDRLAAHIRITDRHAQDFCRRLGFTFECRRPAHFRDGEDASVWTLCPFESRLAARLLFDDRPGQSMPATAPSWTFGQPSFNPPQPGA